MSRTFAEELRCEEEMARKRFIHHTRPKGLMGLVEAIAYVERFDPLPRCEHGNCLRDGSGEALGTNLWMSRPQAITVLSHAARHESNFPHAGGVKPLARANRRI
jgi:hypothetical protein